MPTLPELRTALNALDGANNARERLAREWAAIEEADADIEGIGTRALTEHEDAFAHNLALLEDHIATLEANAPGDPVAAALATVAKKHRKRLAKRREKRGPKRAEV